MPSMSIHVPNACFCSRPKTNPSAVSFTIMHVRDWVCWNSNSSVLTFVLPHVDYCSVVWNHCGVVLRDRVERIQKYALRIIHGKPPRTSSEPLQRALGWTTLEKRRYKGLACLVHRCLSGEAPSFLCSKFRPSTALGYIRTRGANKVHLPRPKMEYFQSTFTFQGALLYNQLKYKKA